MKRLYHGTLMVNGRPLMVDIPFLITKEQYAKWFAELEALDREQRKEMGEK